MAWSQLRICLMGAVVLGLGADLASAQISTLRSRIDSLEQRFNSSLDAHDGYAQGREQFEQNVESRISRLESDIAAMRAENMAIQSHLARISTQLEQSNRPVVTNQPAFRVEVQSVLDRIVDRGYKDADVQRQVAELKAKVAAQRNAAVASNTLPTGRTSDRVANSPKRH